MNFTFIHENGLGAIFATAILVFFAILIAGGVLALVISIKKEREYSKTALPSLDFENDEEEVEEVEESSRFEIDLLDDDEEIFKIADQETNELMEGLSKAKAREESEQQKQAAREEMKNKFTNIFAKKDKG